jgi:hypothetical protein
MRLGFDYSSEKNTHHQPFTETSSGLVDSLPSRMEGAGDKGGFSTCKPLKDKVLQDL